MSLESKASSTQTALVHFYVDICKSMFISVGFSRGHISRTAAHAMKQGNERKEKKAVGLNKWVGQLMIERVQKGAQLSIRRVFESSIFRREHSRQ